MERPAEGREGERPREPHLSPAREDARAPFCIRVDPPNQRFSFPLRALCDLSLPTGQAVGLNHGGEKYGMTIKTPRSLPGRMSAPQSRGRLCAFSFGAEHLSAPASGYEKGNSVCR